MWTAAEAAFLAELWQPGTSSYVTRHRVLEPGSSIPEIPRDFNLTSRAQNTEEKCCSEIGTTCWRSFRDKINGSTYSSSHGCRCGPSPPLQVTVERLKSTFKIIYSFKKKKVKLVGEPGAAAFFAVFSVFLRSYTCPSSSTNIRAVERRPRALFITGVRSIVTSRSLPR